MTIPFRRSRSAVRPSPVFLAVLALTALGGALAWQADADTRGARVGVFLFVLAGWILTVCLHEFAHAFLAWRFGDDEVAARGYLTLNPLKYSHPLLSIILPVLFIAIGGIGLPGGAVYLHSHRFRTDLQRAVVSLSGPAVNVVCAIGLLALAKTHLSNATVYLFLIGQPAPGAHTVFWVAVAGLGLLQVMASVLNLLPIPGLDGFGIIEPYLDPSVRNGAEQFKPFGMLAVFALLQVNSLNRLFFNAIYWLYESSGLDRATGQLGLQLLRFWQST